MSRGTGRVLLWLLFLGVDVARQSEAVGPVGRAAVVVVGVL